MVSNDLVVIKESESCLYNRVGSSFKSSSELRSVGCTRHVTNNFCNRCLFWYLLCELAYVIRGRQIKQSDSIEYMYMMPA